jgi:hypothetical protein
MKTTCLLFFLMVSCAASMQGTGYAAPSNPASQQTFHGSAANKASDNPHGAPAANRKHQKGGKPSDEQPDRRHVSDKNHPLSRASLTGANRPNQLPNNREHFPSGNAMKLHQPGSDNSGGAARGGLIQHETVNSALPVRPANVIRPTMPSLTNVRNRGANPAVIGGSANSDGRKNGAINGTRMIRRP